MEMPVSTNTVNLKTATESFTEDFDELPDSFIPGVIGKGIITTPVMEISFVTGAPSGGIWVGGPYNPGFQGKQLLGQVGPDQTQRFRLKLKTPATSMRFRHAQDFPVTVYVYDEDDLVDKHELQSKGVGIYESKATRITRVEFRQNKHKYDNSVLLDDFVFGR